MDQECRGAFDEFLELAPAERVQPYDLASKTHSGAVPSNDQNNFNPYAHCSVQIARGHKGDMEKWLNFIKQFDVTCPPILVPVSELVEI